MSRNIIEKEEIFLSHRRGGPGQSSLPLRLRSAQAAPLGRNDGRELRFARIDSARTAVPPSRHFDRSPGPWAGAEWRNPEGAPPTPQAPACARRPSPAGFLHSLRFGRNDGRVLRFARIGGARPPPPLPSFRPPHPSFRPEPRLRAGRSGEIRRALRRRLRFRRAPGARRQPDFSTRFASVEMTVGVTLRSKSRRGGAPVEMTGGKRRAGRCRDMSGFGVRRGGSHRLPPAFRMPADMAPCSIRAGLSRVSRPCGRSAMRRPVP